MEDLQILKGVTGCQDETLLASLLEMAEEEILALTNRTVLIDRLKPAKRKWALIAYNRMGTEGETSRSEGGISASFVEIPAEIKSVVEQCRIARVAGHAHEKKADENVPDPETAG
nr:MAG TPA: Head Tail Connector Protein [Caudoviricetes sp.]